MSSTLLCCRSARRSEAEISGMDLEEKELFLADMGLTESGLDRLINACYSCSVSSPT